MKRTSLLFILVVVFSVASPPGLAQVYHIKDGSVEVGKLISAPESNQIKLKSLSGIVSFPKESVIAIEDASEIRRKLEKFRSRLNIDNGDHAATLARWCRQKGCYKEMFELYDRLVKINPENRDLISFINDMSISIRYDGLDSKILLSTDEGRRLINKLNISGPTFREIGKKIISSYPRERKLAILMHGLKSSIKMTQILSIELLSRFTPKEALEPIIGCAILSKKEDVRIAAVKALNCYEVDGIIYPFIRALKSKYKTYRLNALDAIANFKDPRAAGALISNLGSSKGGTPTGRRGNIFIGGQHSVVTGFDVNVATAAAIAKPRVSIIQDGVVLDVNILGVSPGAYYVIKKKERALTAKTLKTVTGQDYGDDYLLWNEWWNKNQARIFKK